MFSLCFQRLCNAIFFFGSHSWCSHKRYHIAFKLNNSEKANRVTVVAHYTITTLHGDMIFVWVLKTRRDSVTKYRCIVPYCYSDSIHLQSRMFPLVWFFSFHANANLFQTAFEKKKVSLARVMSNASIVFVGGSNKWRAINGNTMLNKMIRL